jgi:hypothetical protein
VTKILLVSWKFLEYVLARLSFCDTWRKWITSCIFSSHVSILVNSSPIDDSQIMRDFRQGDPLVPFAFAAIIEGLYRLVMKVVADGKFTEYKVLERETHIFGR